MTPSQKRWFGAAALALAVPAGWAWLRLATHRADPLQEFYGARLGMTASDLRRAFAWPGTFEVRSEGAAPGELAVEWTPLEGERSIPVDLARFEFHEGLLVAIRADVTGTASMEHLDAAEPFVATDAVVLHRAPADSPPHDPPRAHITILARGCPTHAEEVHRLTGL